MTILKSASMPVIRLLLPMASVATFFASATMAGDLNAGLSDPTVISAKRFGDDVSAFYLGLSGGYGSGGDDRFGLGTPVGTFSIGDLEVNGTYAGIRGGWRGVLPARGGRSYVYGIEAGYDFGELDDSVSTLIGTETVRGGSKVSDVFSVRLRNGLTNPSGRTLYFVSVGYVWGDIETTSSFGSAGALATSSESDRRGGYSASIGAEHKLTEDWSLTGEYEYVRFDSKEIQFDSGFSTKSTPGYRGFRVGLNYKF